MELRQGTGRRLKKAARDTMSVDIRHRLRTRLWCTVKRRLHRRVYCHAFKKKKGPKRSIFSTHIPEKRMRVLPLFPFTLEELAEHLERHFHEGMSWERMELWAIDHVRPVSSFVFHSPMDKSFQDCFSLENLRPMWNWENSKKGAKWLDEGIHPYLPGF